MFIVASVYVWNSYNQKLCVLNIVWRIIVVKCFMGNVFDGDMRDVLDTVSGFIW